MTTQSSTSVMLLHVEKFDIRLNIDLRYFPDREQTEHSQWIGLAFFEAARHNFSIVYGTKGIASIVKMKIGNNPLFSSEVAMGKCSLSMCNAYCT